MENFFDNKCTIDMKNLIFPKLLKIFNNKLTIKIINTLRTFFNYSE